MKVKQRYVVAFALMYGLSVFGLYQFHENSSLKMVPFTITSDEEMVIDFESIYNPLQVSETLTVGFKLDFIQKPVDLQIADKTSFNPSNKKWEERSLVFKDLFNIIHYSTDNKDFKGNVVNKKIAGYIDAYKDLGYEFNAKDTLNIDDISYFGTYDVYLIDDELDYEKLSVCRVFESKKDNYRAIVVNNTDETYDIIFDENQDLVVNYLYHDGDRGLEKMHLGHAQRIEEQIYSYIVEMVRADTKRVDIVNKIERLILLKQEKEIG